MPWFLEVLGLSWESGCNERFGTEGKILPPDGQMLYGICSVNRAVKSCPGDHKNKPEGSPYVPLTDQGKVSSVSPNGVKKEWERCHLFPLLGNIEMHLFSI